VHLVHRAIASNSKITLLYLTALITASLFAHQYNWGGDRALVTVPGAIVEFSTRDFKREFMREDEGQDRRGEIPCFVWEADADNRAVFFRYKLLQEDE
jgi:hypothetical protein